MSKSKEISNPKKQKPIRILPGIVIVILQWICWLIIPYFTTSATATMIYVFGGLLGGLGIFIWWAFFSRAQILDRLLGVGVMIIALVVIPKFSHESIETGLNGLMYFVYAIPTLCLAFVICVILSKNLSIQNKRISMVLSIILACGVWTLVRSDSLSGNAKANFTWRWSVTNEEKLLANSENEILNNSSILEGNQDIEWPGFRGVNRDNIIHDVKINTDWKTSPPVELWRQAIGPGCSSFAVRGSLFYTQEQRGEEEVVSCYNLMTGESIWKHYDAARFWDSHAGAGPRGTPTLSDSIVVTLGATGILNVLDNRNGNVIWSRNTAKDINVDLKEWGISSSPLIVDNVIIVAVYGTLIAYNRVSGEQVWKGPDGGENYTSPHLVTIDSVEQILMMTMPAMMSFSPKDGKILWEKPWEGGSIVQPTITENGDIIISESFKKGIYRIAVTHNSGEWSIEEKWKSTKLRPDFNDHIIYNNHLYGFEGFSIACIDLSDGSRKWKSGRYGGQVLLLAEQGLIILLSEKGEIVLIESSTDKLIELHKMQAIEGKTWNHPVIVNDILLVRNTQEMVAYKLPILE